jgi:hypothetical protein
VMPSGVLFVGRVVPTVSLVFLRSWELLLMGFFLCCFRGRWFTEALGYLEFVTLLPYQSTLQRPRYYWLSCRDPEEEVWWLFWCVLFDRSVDECVPAVWMTGLVVDGAVELLLFYPRFWILGGCCLSPLSNLSSKAQWLLVELSKLGDRIWCGALNFADPIRLKWWRRCDSVVSNVEFVGSDDRKMWCFVRENSVFSWDCWVAQASFPLECSARVARRWYSRNLPLWLELWPDLLLIWSVRSGFRWHC